MNFRAIFSKRSAVAVMLAAACGMAPAAPASIDAGAVPATVVLRAAIGAPVDATPSAVLPAPVSRVPEPGVFALVFAGLAVVIWRVRRQRGR
jgi:hypothetical protein